MGFFSGLNKAKERGNSDRFNPGIYPAIRVDELKYNKGHNGERFILVGTVLAPAEVREKDKEGEPVQPTPVGGQGSWSTRLDGQYPEIGLGEIKSLLRTLCEAQGTELPEDVEALAQRAVGPEQPFRGTVIGTEAWYHKTKSKYTMTVHAWKAAEGEYDASAHPVESSTEATNPPAPATPPATPPTPAQSPEDRARAAGYQPNTADPSGTWWWNPSTNDQKTLADFAA